MGLIDSGRFAVGTLTRFPVPPPRDLTPRVAATGLTLAPLIGAGIGLVSGIPVWLGEPDLMHRLLASTMTVGIAAFLTRGLHLDGVADFADGLGSRAAPERARAIMSQSDIGPFGVLTLIFVVLGQVLALSCLPDGAPALAGWVIACSAARAAITIGCGPWAIPARADGLGALVIGSVNSAQIALSAALLLGITLTSTALGGLDLGLSLLAATVAIPVAWGTTAIARGRFGGSTGDVLGAIAELTAVASMLILTLG